MLNEDFSNAPYFDDFDRTKGFHRILFKPGVSVQARELNQLQTVLQEQINRLGTHMFKNGSIVIPGAVKHSKNSRYVCIDDVGGDIASLADFVGKRIYQDFSGKTLYANVKLAEVIEGKNVLIVAYENSATKLDGGQLVNVTKFEALSPILVDGFEGDYDLRVSENGPVLSVDGGTTTYRPSAGNATTADISEGVFFFDGYFVFVESQSIIVDPFSSAPTKKVGLAVEKKIVDAYDDITLFDNASGYSNEAAPGADRLSITMELQAREIDGPEADDFIELIRFESGLLRLNKQNSDYNILGDALARRTYDESGDYAVHGYDVKVIDHRRDSVTPDGLKTPAEGGNDNLLAVEVGPGKAYVKGYEVENLSNVYLEVDKARIQDSLKFVNEVIQVNDNGAHIFLAPGNRFINIEDHPIIWLTNGFESTSVIIGYCVPAYVDAVSISGQTIFKLYGSFYLSQSVTYGWDHIGGWRLDDLHNGPVLQVARFAPATVISNFNVVDGLPLTSHAGYTPYAWDSGNKHLYIKKAQSVGVFNKDLQVIKGSASGYVQDVVFKVEGADGQGNLIKLDIPYLKTIKDDAGNTEIQADMGFTGQITTNASGYGELNFTGDGVFVGDPVAANILIDNAYYANIVNIENEGKRLVINNVTLANSLFSVSATLRKNLLVRSKTLIEGQTIITNPSSRKMCLLDKDVYRIKAIHVSANTATAPTTLDPELTPYYTLERNASTDLYLSDFIKPIQGQAVAPGQLLVIYDYFSHGVGDVFTVDSYVAIKDDPLDASDLTHISRIPKMVSRDDVKRLGDYFDFRRAVKPGFHIVAGSTTTGSANINVQEDYRATIAVGSPVFCKGFSLTATVASVTETAIVVDEVSTFSGTIHAAINSVGSGDLSNPFSNPVNFFTMNSASGFTYDATYFLERWDRVTINKDGVIGYKYGTPGISNYPDVPADSMSLATIKMAPFTETAKSVSYRKDDNRRYTMRDIGKLERRIENLEYYTTLSMKEMETLNLKITDAETGLDRFKSGLFVSDFRDFEVFNPYSEGFLSTLVPERNRLIPHEFSASTDLGFVAGISTGYVEKGGNLYLPYTHSVEIEQPFATFKESVNPYLIITWTPEMTLTPAQDNWVETEWAPSIVNTSNISRTIINDSTVVGSTSTRFNDINRTVSVMQAWNTPSIRRETEQSIAGVESRVVSVSTSQTVSTTSEEVGRRNRLVGQSIIPLMRSNTVRFFAKGLKPDTRFFPSFDGVSVAQFCRPVNHSTLVTGAYGAALVADGMGSLMGDFQIPHNRFSTGQKTLTLADYDIITYPEAGTECMASSVYTANGVLRTMQEVIDILNTSTVTINRVTTRHETTVVNRINTTFVGIPRQNNGGDGGGDGGGDPLAQSFDTNGIPAAGMFVTKIDLYFASKDPFLPCFIELRQMVNGYPVTNRIKDSLVGLPASAINISANSTVATTFEFDHPVYLEANKEYAVIVFAHTSRHWLWCSRLGEKVVNADRIVGKQPHLGTLFKSQNASTWTPFQYEDLKFRLHRANFNTGATGSVKFQNSGNYNSRRVQVSDIETTAGSKLVKVYHPCHGMVVNEKVVISANGTVGATNDSPPGTKVYNGIPMSELYGSKVVKQTPDANHFIIEVLTSATATGAFEESGKYVWIRSNANYYRYKYVNDAFAPMGTAADYFATLKSGKDFDGGQSYGVPISEFGVVMGEPTYMPHVGVLQQPENELTDKSVTVDVRLKSTNSYLSPVLTKSGSSFAVSSLNLNFPTTVNETDPQTGNVTSKVETQIIKLKTPAASLRIYTSESKQEKEGIEVYYRTTLNRDLEEKTWIKVDPVANALTVDVDQFIEHERIVDTIADFNEFQVKIIFRGTDSVRHPAVKELRAIAVAR